MEKSKKSDRKFDDNSFHLKVVKNNKNKNTTNTSTSSNSTMQHMRMHSHR